MEGARRSLAALAAAALLCGCMDGSNGVRDVRFGGKKREGAPLSQAELQQDVQRFAGQFMDRVAQAAEPLADVKDPRVRQTAMRRVLLYGSTAVDIASGPLPELNVLDMIVFLSLSRHSLERYWNPQVFGEGGAPLLAAFEQSEHAMAPIATRLLTAEQRADLGALIDAWERANPDQHRVEGVRFIEFSALAGRVSVEQGEKARGLLSDVKAATQTADQAVLLGDRALFLANRMPFLIRLQARLGVQEATLDTLGELDSLERMLTDMPASQQMVQNVGHMATGAANAARETRMLLVQLEPLLARIEQLSKAAAKSDRAAHEHGASIQQTMATAERLTDKTTTILRELRALSPEDPGRMLDGLEQRSDRLVRRWIGYLVLLGAAWAVLLWGGYFVVKRFSA
jgi:hypothetical protein